MPNGFSGCVLVKLPIVIADVVDSIDVDNVICPEEQAKKVDHIDVSVRDLEADPNFSGPITNNPGHPCTSPKATVHFGEPVCGPHELRSITIHGEIHEQIYYVNRDDDVRHMREDIPFSETIKLNPPLVIDNPNNIDIDFRDVDVDVNFELPRASRIRQNITVSFTLKITEDQQIYIATCLPVDDIIGQQVLQNTGFEAFTGCVLNVWQQSNVAPGQPGRNGGFSVGLGGPPSPTITPGTPAPTGCFANPQESASLIQQIPAEVIRPGLRYEFCFYVQEIEPTGTVGTYTNYTLDSRVVFRDAAGNPINSAAATQLQDENINGTWRQVCVTSNVAPEGAVSGSVEILFTPINTGANGVPAPNGAYVLIDDATLTVRQ